MGRRVYDGAALVEEWDDNTRTYQRWVDGLVVQTRPYTGAEAAPLDAAVADAAQVAAGAARRVALAAAIARLRVIEDATRTNPGLRGVDAWAQTHRVKICDAMADMAQILRWLVQQQVEPGDPAD